MHPKGQGFLGLTLRVNSAMAEMSQWQELMVASHTASAVRNQKVSASAQCFPLSVLPSQAQEVISPSKLWVSHLS